MHPLKVLAEESLDYINDGHFLIVDPGPLHAPIRSFKLLRNDKLGLILKTECPGDATSSAVDHPPGKLRLATERVMLRSVAGTEAELLGVIGRSVNSRSGPMVEGGLREEANVHRVTIRPPDPAAAAFTIDWLENLPNSHYAWPHSIRTVKRTTVTRGFAIGDDGLTMSASDETVDVNRSAVKLTVDGWTFYVCALGGDRGDAIHPGCIVYVGTPDEGFRKKVRTALSFAFGVYLVDLGSTLYDGEWRIVLATAVSAYSLGMRAFDLGPRQFAPLGPKYQYEVHPVELGRMVGAFVSAYDALDLGNLSWAYWHACSATVHIAPANLGAAIESLQRTYIASNPAKIARTLMPAADWRMLRARIEEVVDGCDATEEAKTALKDQLGRVNRVDQRPLLRSVLAALGLGLGVGEDDAWKRRDKAAHGMAIPEAQEQAAIGDMLLLRGLFQRMLLRIVDAADHYVDYASPTHPYRRLEDPPSGDGCPPA